MSGYAQKNLFFSPCARSVAYKRDLISFSVSLGTSVGVGTQMQYLRPQTVRMESSQLSIGVSVSQHYKILLIKKKLKILMTETTFMIYYLFFWLGMIKYLIYVYFKIWIEESASILKKIYFFEIFNIYFKIPELFLKSNFQIHKFLSFLSNSAMVLLHSLI